MKKVTWIFILVIFVLSSCSKIQTKPLSALPSTFPKIDRQPNPANYSYLTNSHFPTYDPESDDPWQMDLRSANLSTYDLSNSFDDFNVRDFRHKNNLASSLQNARTI